MNDARSSAGALGLMQLMPAGPGLGRLQRRPAQSTQMAARPGRGGRSPAAGGYPALRGNTGLCSCRPGLRHGLSPPPGPAPDTHRFGSMERGIVCILGGSGFVGRHLAHRLGRLGYRVRIPSRRPHRHPELRVDPAITLIPANVHDPDTLRRLVSGCTAVVNLVGVLNASPEGFREAHVELPRKLVEAMRTAGVPRARARPWSMPPSRKGSRSPVSAPRSSSGLTTASPTASPDCCA